MDNDEKSVHEDDLALDAAEQELLDTVADALADPSVWAQPPLDLQEKIVSAIQEQSAAERTPRRSRTRLYAVLGVAAALVIASGVAFGIVRNQQPDLPVTFAATLSGSALEPQASGRVVLTKTTSGWRIHLHAEGLPRRADGAYYEAWLKSASGVLVPVGTFNSFRDVTLWAGVPPADYPTFTVTRQLAGGDPASTGEVVLSGSTSRTH